MSSTDWPVCPVAGEAPGIALVDVPAGCVTLGKPFVIEGVLR